VKKIILSETANFVAEILNLVI